MKSIMNSALVVLAVIAVVLAMPRHQSIGSAGSATLSLQELEAAAGTDRLPVQRLHDRSVVFSTLGTP